MHRSTMVSLDGSGAWGGLALEVADRRRPGLRMEVATGGLLLLRQEERPVLLARVEAGHWGVDFHRTGTFVSPVAPLRADQARRLADGEPGEWPARWAHQLAGELAAAPASPLHAGRWSLTPMTQHLLWSPWSDPKAGAGRRWDALLAGGDPDGHLDWDVTGRWWRVLPLRRLPGPGTDRVKAYRRQLRDGVLPPILLWFISGLECHVLVDGHHRLAAAIAEDHAPAFLALALRRPDEEVRELAAKYTRDYTRTVDRLQQLVQSDTPGAAAQLARTHDQFARLIHGVAGQPGPTRAWPLPGGTEAWQSTAATIAPASSVSRPVQDPGEIEPAPEDRAV